MSTFELIEISHSDAMTFVRDNADDFVSAWQSYVTSSITGSDIISSMNDRDKSSTFYIGLYVDDVLKSVSKCSKSGDVIYGEYNCTQNVNGNLRWIHSKAVSTGFVRLAKSKGAKKVVVCGMRRPNDDDYAKSYQRLSSDNLSARTITSVDNADQTRFDITINVENEDQPASIDTDFANPIDNPDEFD